MTVKLPSDVVRWLIKIFKSANERVSGKLSRIPTHHEVSFDATFIEHLSEVGAPIRFPSKWALSIDTHFLGGMRHFLRRWEIADIGVLASFRHKGKLVRTKIALLQSKRLYPDEQHIDEDRLSMYTLGFARLHADDDAFRVLTQPRRLTLTSKSRYAALSVGDEQYKAIADYEASKKIPVHYLLYNPLRLPTVSYLPLASSAPKPNGSCVVGARVLPAATVRNILKSQSQGFQPAYCDMLSAPYDLTPHRAGWRLEHFIVNLVLGCHEGYVASGRNDDGLREVFFRRAGPIAAAIGINIDSPIPYAD